MTFFERLSAQDASFLTYEDRDPNAHMHVGGVSVYEGGSLVTARGGIDIERVREYVASRLHMIPRYRQKLAWTPLLGEPVWVDDDRFNVRYHVRHMRLPRPGDERELKRLAGRIMSQRLDRHRPLWELWLIEGLPDGRFSMLTKTHHCMIDGVSGVDISTVLMQVDADGQIEPAPEWTPRPAPTRLDLLRDELARRSSVPLAVLRTTVDAIQHGGSTLASLSETMAGVGRLAALAWQGPARTPLNQPLGPHRRFDWTGIPLSDVKAIKQRLGGTVNDVLLAIVSGAIGEFLRRRRVNVDILDFLGAIPVNTRAGGDRSMGNHVAAWLAKLPIAERDPRRRYERVVAVTSELKTQRHADPTAHLFELAEIGGPPALAFVVQLMQRMSPANLIVTNVPGPPFPLYILGARMMAACPMVTLLAEQGLGIAVFSYLDTLQFGFNADWDLLPDLHDLVLDVERAADELRRVAGLTERAA